MKRIFVGTVAQLLVCVSSLLPACDLSCGFSVFKSDCHSPQIAPPESDHPEMAMAGMTMPESASDTPANQPVVSPVRQQMPAHAALVDMGACTRQSCDQAPGLVSISIHSAATQFDRISAVTGFSGTSVPNIVFRDDRDDISPPDHALQLFLDVSLRI